MVGLTLPTSWLVSIQHLRHNRVRILTVQASGCKQCDKEMTDQPKVLAFMHCGASQCDCSGHLKRPMLDILLCNCPNESHSQRRSLTKFNGVGSNAVATRATTKMLNFVTV